MDAGWRLGPSARAELAAILAGYADTARRLGATAITFLGTEPVRRAGDGASIVAAVQRASGVPLHVLDHAEEALLTLIGVTGGRPATAELVVADVGGGSTELAFVGPDRPAETGGLRVGASTLTARHVAHDPAAPAELERLRDAARSALRAAPDARPTDMIAVGGTASNLVRLLGEAEGDRTLTPRRIEAAVEQLCAEPASVVAGRFGIRPARARLLPAGAAILTALLERYGLELLLVSDVGIREGTVLATLHDPIGWRDRLPKLARGWVR